jgi:hypothetical protein
MPARHVVTSERPWWWNPPGLQPGEWAEWLRAVKALDPHQRAHRLASAAAASLYVGTRVVEVRCRLHGSFVAEVRATPRGPLFRSAPPGAFPGTPDPRVDLLDFDGCDAPLAVWCARDRTTKSVERDRVLAAVETAARSGYVVFDV